jgi:hypothetical protein
MVQVAHLGVATVRGVGSMDNLITTALTNAARFRAEEGDATKAEQLLRKSIQLADSDGAVEGRFFARVHLAHFLTASGRLAEAELAYQDALSNVSMASFNLRHTLAMREYGELLIKMGRTDQGEALLIMAERLFGVLADDICQATVQTFQSCAS